MPTALVLPTQPKVQKKAGLYIAPADLELLVTGPGGGGERIRYLPYKDLSAPLLQVLESVYTTAVRVDKSDEGTLRAAGVTLLVVPKLTTTSSGEGAKFTWPPRKFNLTLKVTATDPAGKVLWTETVDGEGTAITKDVITGDYGVAARRASKAALEKLARVLLEREGSPATSS